MALTLFLVSLGFFIRLWPHAPGAVALGAIALYAGARLPRRWAAVVPLAALSLSDLFLGWPTGHAILRVTIYATFAAIVFLGATLPLRSGVVRMAGYSVTSSLLFYATSNFAFWAEAGFYPKTPHGLASCYLAGLPYLRNSIVADLAGTAFLFGADAVLRRSLHRRRALAALVVTVLLGGRIARAQTPAPVSEDVVVSASLSPETEPSVSASVTVITRDRIEKSGKTDVLELLRTVPGVDVVQSGGAGKVTSVFLRGANSFQTLVLIDGIRVNSPYSSGYDFSSLAAQDVERIEVVRGPFSALYGADAVGGVISIIRRVASVEPAGRVTAAAGNRSFHEETLFASAGSGPFALSLSGRDVHDGGDPQTVSGTRVDNDGWRDRTGSADFAWMPNDGFRAGFGVERTWARSEIPSDGALATPHRTTDFAQTIWTLPIRARLGARNQLTGSLSEADSHPASSDPDDASGFIQSDTVAKTRGARAADTWTISANQAVSASASYERSTVDSRGAFGPIVSGRRTAIWGVAAEDQWNLLDSRLRAVAGVRYDRHSQFGSATSPRVSLVWNAAPSDAVRLSYGSGFRAPSIVDLYYPFYGNPDLKPERSNSYEIGFAHRARGVAWDVALFRNDIRDLIQYDVVRQLPGNVGRARTEGVEASASSPLAGPLAARISYTYLRAVDETTGTPLVRRPRHRGALDLAWNADAWTATATALFEGRRADFQAAFPYGPTENSSYVRFDAHAEYRLGRISPFVTVANLTDRRYEETNGFPARRRRIMGGLIASF